MFCDKHVKEPYTGYNKCASCEIEMYKKENNRLKKLLAESKEIVKAVAHVGIDWGYGKFELTQEYIDNARQVYEKLEKDSEK